jgi:hypothetical protein
LPKIQNLKLETLAAVWARLFMVCGWCWYFGIAFDSHFLILFICLQNVTDNHETRLGLTRVPAHVVGLGILRQHATFDDAEKIKKIKNSQ